MKDSHDKERDKDRKASFALGPDVVGLLLPHGRPFRMVDTIDEYVRGEAGGRSGQRPSLRASRYISANEPVFEGHFPGLSLWPGIHTIEGMGQSCNLLRILLGLEAAWDAAGRAPGGVREGLRNLDRGFRMDPGYRAEAARDIREILSKDLADPLSRAGVSAAVDVKFLKPVFAGQRLEYAVALTHEIEGLLRFDVRAEVAGHIVARGTMSGAMGAAISSAFGARA